MPKTIASDCLHYKYSRMKWSITSLFSVALTAITLFACAKKSEPAPAEQSLPEHVGNNDSNAIKMKITVGTKHFSATLADNATAKAFKALLPLKISMTELNGNEKYYDLPGNLPTNASAPGTIRNGDLLLWGSKTLVVFYKTFSSGYSYTRIGRIDNPDGLANALGSGNVEVRFTLE